MHKTVDLDKNCSKRSKYKILLNLLLRVVSFLNNYPVIQLPNKNTFQLILGQSIFFPSASVLYVCFSQFSFLCFCN